MRACCLNSRTVLLVGALIFTMSTTASAQTSSVASEAKKNVFDDPLVQITQGIRHCSVPESPGYTTQKARLKAHYRAERGTSCYRAGRCRLPNAYLYDKEIIPRVEKSHFDIWMMWNQSSMNGIPTTLARCAQRVPVRSEVKGDPLERRSTFA